MTKEMLGGLVRTLVATLGGFAIGRGWADAGLVEAVGGALSTVAVAFWSYRSKVPAAGGAGK